MKNKKTVFSIEEQEKMTDHLSTNPILCYSLRVASMFVLSAIDDDFFSKEKCEEDKHILDIAKKMSPDKDPVHEFLIYKTMNLLYHLITTLEKCKALSINEPLSTKSQIMIKAQQSWNNYKKDRGVV